MVNTNTNVQHQATNQDQHMQTVRILPNQPSQQISGDMIHAKVYVANQGSSGNVSEIHSSQVIQQNVQPVLQTAVSVSSTGQVPLQQQTPIQMQGGMSNYIPNDPNLSIRQIHQQSTAPQSQQSNQTRQFIQQQSQIQALSSHQAQQQPNQTHQMQHPPIIQHQQSHMLQASQIAQQQASNSIPASGAHQPPTQQTVLVQHFQQANINNQQTTNSVTTHDQQPNSEISQRFDQGTLASKSVPYTLAGGQSIGSNTVASSIQHSIQHTAGPLPVKQPLIGGTVVQPSSSDSVNSSLPPSRPDPSVATYSNISATGLNLPQQISGATTQIEKVNLVNAQQIVASTSQHVPLDDAGSIENKKTNVGEQLMDRLEQISRTQGNWATTTGDGVDSESMIEVNPINMGAIDNRISEAMDIVKSHLMNTVRSEVEELKEKIQKLETTIHHLQCENNVLKRYIPSDTLQRISENFIATPKFPPQVFSSSVYPYVPVNENQPQSQPACITTAVSRNTVLTDTYVTLTAPSSLISIMLATPNSSDRSSSYSSKQ